MKWYLFAILTLLFTGCSENTLHTIYKPSSASIIVDEIQKKVLLQLKKEQNLFPCEFGGGSKTPIKLLHIGFVYFNEIDIEKGRKLLLIAGIRFIKEINSNESIRPFLSIYPFSLENIQVEIFLKQGDGSELEPEKIHVITMKKGNLKYKTGLPSPPNHPLTTIYQETYEEAAEKLGINLSFGLIL